MDIDMKEAVKFYVIAIVCGLIAVYGFMYATDGFIKAQKYDYYQDVIETVDNCYTRPTIICPVTKEQASKDLLDDRLLI